MKSVVSSWFLQFKIISRNQAMNTTVQTRTSTAAQVNVPCLDAANISTNLAQTEVPLVNSGTSLSNGAPNAAAVVPQLDASTAAVADATNTYNGPGILVFQPKPAVATNNIAATNVPVLVS